MIGSMGLICAKCGTGFVHSDIMRGYQGNLYHTGCFVYVWRTRHVPAKTEPVRVRPVQQAHTAEPPRGAV